MSALTTARYAPGEMLDDKYRVDTLLSEGGMGTVYAGTHTLLQKRVAIKVLKAELAANEAMVARFRREAVAASAIGHPNIVAVTDVGSTKSGVAFLVMELLEGRSLARVIRDEAPLPAGRACAIACEVLKGVAAAHHTGIVHRDIKPDNVFLVDHGAGGASVKILDFGIATFARSSTPSPRLTTTGTIVGTPAFMAPEQARGDKEVGPTVDVYATGVLLYEMLAARLPYDGGNYNVLIHQILSGEIVKLSTLRPDLPAELEAVIARAMALDPKDRFPSAADLAEALAPFAAPDLSSSNPPVTGGRPQTGERARIKLPTPAAPEIDAVAHTVPSAEPTPAASLFAPTLATGAVAPVRRTGKPIALAAIAIAGVGAGLVWWRLHASTPENADPHTPPPASSPALDPALLACAGTAASSHAVDPLQISGTVFDPFLGRPMGGVHVALLRRDHLDDAPLGSADTTVDGSFAFAVVTGGAPVDAIVRYTRDGYRTTWVDPGDAMTADLVNLHLPFHPLYTSAELDELAREAGVGARDPSHGLAIILVHDCARRALAGATVTLDVPGTVVYLGNGLAPAPKATATSGSGIGFMFGPPGRAIVRASITGRELATRPIDLRAGDVTIIVVHP